MNLNFHVDEYGLELRICIHKDFQRLEPMILWPEESADTAGKNQKS